MPTPATRTPSPWTAARARPTGSAAPGPPPGLAGAGGANGERAWRRHGDVLCLFTDGLVDAQSEAGERYGEERILGHVRNLRRRPTREILEAIFTDLAAFTGGAPASDDRTLLLLKA